MSPTTEPFRGQTVTVTRILNFPRERVYAAFTSAEKMSQWFGCSATKKVETDFEPVVGKTFSMHMEYDHPEHGVSQNKVTGKVLEACPPERLRFTFNFNMPECSHDTEVEVDFLERDGATEIRLQHHYVVDVPVHDGWSAAFEKLEKCLAN